MKVWVANIMLMISLVNVGTFALGSEREDFVSDTGISLSSGASQAVEGVSQEEPGSQVPCPSVHVCHLGHCGFVIGLPSELKAPEYYLTEYRPRRTSFADVDLLSKKKPPKAKLFQAARLPFFRGTICTTLCLWDPSKVREILRAV